MSFKAIVLFVCLTSLNAVPPQYFSSEAYLSLSAKEKSELLFKEITYDSTPQGYFGDLKTASMLIQDNWPTMNWIGDVLPEGRDKLIHSEGVVALCEVNFKPDSGYSGLFKANNPYSIIRLSAASEFSTKDKSAKGAYDNFTPGMGLKVLVDGQKSENLVSMYDTVKQFNWDFFDKSFSNMFDIDIDTPLKKRLVARAFSKVTNNISTVGLKGWSEVDPRGFKVAQADVKFPFQLIFTPTNAVKGVFKKEYTIDYKYLLATIPRGTVIYDIYAVEKPGCEAKLVGEIKLKSNLVTSKFGDRQLFFRHGLIDYDDSHTKDQHSEFGKYRDSFGVLGRYEKEDPKGKFRCPFAS